MPARKSTPAKKLRPTISEPATSKFKGGLRGYFEYRDLGVSRASGGKVHAHVIRALPAKAPHGDWHYHDCQVQFTYVLKGWVRMQYEGQKPITLKAGACFYQPPRIKHRELAHSVNLVTIEVTAPRRFKTYDAKVD